MIAALLAATVRRYHGHKTREDHLESAAFWIERGWSYFKEGKGELAAIRFMLATLHIKASYQVSR